MPNDYIKKEPTKTEKMLYEVVMAQNQMEKGLWSTSTLVMALAILSKAKPEEIAELMVNGDDKIREFSGKVNEIAKKLDEAKHKDHDHSKEGHEHA
ncbi:MAG TPA: hypothetical protein VE973_04180 [Candidatus Limnocylindria bacterium]|nr:hypothetical protein [Candidatus Limnocylindria bacterium]